MSEPEQHDSKSPMERIRGIWRGQVEIADDFDGVPPEFDEQPSSDLAGRAREIDEAPDGDDFDYEGLGRALDRRDD